MKRLILISVGIALAATASADEILIKANTHNSALARWTAEDFANARPSPLPMGKSIDDATREVPPPPLLVQETFGSEAAEPTVTGEERYALSRILYDYRLRETSSLEEAPDPHVPDTAAIPQKNRGGSELDYTSSRLIPSAAAETFPYSAVGKLFYRDSTGEVGSCSGAVIARRLVLTAAHCVHGGPGKGWYDDFIFVPAHYYGYAPFDAWEYSHVFASCTWVNSGQTPNVADWALLEMQDRDGYRISDYTGKLGFVINRMAPNHLHILGYPANFDSAEEMHQVTSGAFEYDANNCYFYGNDMTYGSSGGPWIQNFNRKSTGQGGGRNKARVAVVGVTSYGPADGSRKVGASMLNRDFKVFRQKACFHQRGNC